MCTDLTVRQNLAYFARLVGASKDAVDRVISRVGLSEQSRQSVDSLSGGQRNRVSLGIELWELFRSIAAEGTSILVSSHVMDEALRCDRLLLMRAGTIIADTTPAGLLESTGTADPESAFLVLLQDPSHTAAGPAVDPTFTADIAVSGPAAVDPAHPHGRHSKPTDDAATDAS